MAHTPLDPAGFFELDLEHGALRAQGGRRTMVLSELALSRLVTTAVDSGDLTAVRLLGNELGELAQESLPGPPAEQPPDSVFAAATAAIAMYGWGRLQAERWGAALVLQIAGTAELDADNLACAALLGGLFSQLCGREVACVPVADTGKYIMVNPSIAERVWNWSRDGDDVPAIVSKLAPAQ